MHSLRIRWNYLLRVLKHGDAWGIYITRKNADPNWDAFWSRDGLHTYAQEKHWHVPIIGFIEDFQMDINLHAFESLFWYQELDSYPLVNSHIAIENGHRFIVDLPWFTHFHSMVFFQFVMSTLTRPGIPDFIPAEWLRFPLDFGRRCLRWCLRCHRGRRVEWCS